MFMEKTSKTSTPSAPSKYGRDKWYPYMSPASTSFYINVGDGAKLFLWERW
jgi:hypothetical protein